MDVSRALQAGDDSSEFQALVDQINDEYARLDPPAELKAVLDGHLNKIRELLGNRVPRTLELMFQLVRAKLNEATDVPVKYIVEAGFEVPTGQNRFKPFYLLYMFPPIDSNGVIMHGASGTQYMVEGFWDCIAGELVVGVNLSPAAFQTNSDHRSK